MFDLANDHAIRATNAPPTPRGRDVRAQALRLVATSASRLFLAARRIGGDDGAALAAAFADMVRDGSIAPEGWPLDELIELLEDRTAPDRQADRILADLRKLAEALDGFLEHEFDMAVAEPGGSGRFAS